MTSVSAQSDSTTCLVDFFGLSASRASDFGVMKVSAYFFDDLCHCLVALKLIKSVNRGIRYFLQMYL
jgi:hypothetical protein